MHKRYLSNNVNQHGSDVVRSTSHDPLFFLVSHDQNFRWHKEEHEEGEDQVCIPTSTAEIQYYVGQAK